MDSINSVKEELDYIISNKHIRTFFQPIISLKDGNILGYEALSRITCESEIKNSDMLFNVAGKYNRLWELEFLCRNKAFEAVCKFTNLDYDKKLFINVNPNIMHDENFKKGLTKDFLKQYNITANNIIFEITERNVISDISSFISTIRHYKDQDYEIAIDDAGAGYSGLNLISDVVPNYIKIDIKLIRNVNSDRLKFALVKGMVELSKISDIYIIAEGIETYEELDTLVGLGVQYGQGYFIQRPNPEIKEISQEVLQAIKESNLKRNYGLGSSISSLYIENICTCTDIIEPNEMVSDVYDFFKNTPNLFGVCVIENDVPVGIITREALSYQLSGYYGFTLKQKKPVSYIMDKDFLSVDYQMPISTVSSIAMSRQNERLYDFIVVTKNGKYMGTVTVKDLLTKTTEIEVAKAKHQNPLSGLPGNLVVEQNISRCVTNNEDYSVAYFDIDNFKAYNDVYGFENGDLVIKLLANILKDHFSDEQFIGHVGGDDFVAILNETVAEDYFKDIVKQFEFEVLKFYNKADIQKGYIITTNRHGDVEKFPLITLTYVVVNNKEYDFKDEFELTETLAEKKKKAKQKLNVSSY